MYRIVEYYKYLNRALLGYKNQLDKEKIPITIEFEEIMNVCKSILIILEFENNYKNIKILEFKNDWISEKGNAFLENIKIKLNYEN